MSATFAVNAGPFVDGATDILYDLKMRPPVRDMEVIRIELTALGYPAPVIEKIIECYDPNRYRDVS